MHLCKKDAIDVHDNDLLTCRSGASSPGAKARSEPIIVDSNRPAFPALKAYLGAKSPQRSPARNLADDPEIAACRGVSVLQQRFEGGRLVASNVAALQRHFNDPSNTRYDKLGL